MLIIPETAGETSETAKKRFSAALNEENTIFLLFRSNAQNESQVQQVVEKANNMTQWQSKVYRVGLIKDQSLVSDVVTQYFGDAADIIAVSLRYGTGEPRQIGKRYPLSEIDIEKKIGKAFADAKKV